MSVSNRGNDPVGARENSQNGSNRTAPPAGWAMVPGWLFGLKLSTGAIATYALLANFGTFDQSTGTYHECRPSRERLAKLLGTSVETVKRNLRELVDAKAITRATRYGPNGSQLPSSYTVVVGTLTAPVQLDANPQGQQGGSSVTRGGVISDPGGGSSVTHNQEVLNQEPKTHPVVTAAERFSHTESSPTGGFGGEEKNTTMHAASFVDDFEQRAGLTLSKTDKHRLTEAVRDAYSRGVTNYTITEAAYGKTLTGLNNPGAAVAARINKLMAPVIPPSSGTHIACQFVADKANPGFCATCNLPRANARHTISVATHTDTCNIIAS